MPAKELEQQSKEQPATLQDLREDVIRPPILIP